MKFLAVFAICVYSATAASFTPSAAAFASVSGTPQYKPPAPVAPVVTVSKVAVSTAGSEVDAPVLRYESDVKPDGFSYNYETGNGIVAEAAGTLKKVDNVEAIGIQGSYRYIAPDGTPVQVNYIADENGYQPQSDILPVAPPVPVAIARALEYIAAHPPAPETVVVGANRRT